MWARNVEIQCSSALNGLGLHWHSQIKQTSLKACLFTQEREGKLEDVGEQLAMIPMEATILSKGSASSECCCCC